MAPPRLADAVRVTLGPKSKSVLMQSTWGRPTVCNDGVSIAKRVDLQDPEENLGAQMLRQAAERTAEAVGDGTSTATVLAQAILADGVRNVVAGASAIDLKRGLDKGLGLVQAALLAQSRPVDTTREKAQVATLSAHNDPLIGQAVADALEKVGVEGVVSVEESKTTETVVDIMDGMRFDRGTCPRTLSPTLKRCRSNSPMRVYCCVITRSVRWPTCCHCLNRWPRAASR